MGQVTCGGGGLALGGRREPGTRHGQAGHPEAGRQANGSETGNSSRQHVGDSAWWFLTMNQGPVVMRRLCAQCTQHVFGTTYRVPRHVLCMHPSHTIGTVRRQYGQPMPANGAGSQRRKTSGRRGPRRTGRGRKIRCCRAGSSGANPSWSTSKTIVIVWIMLRSK